MNKKDYENMFGKTPDIVNARIREEVGNQLAGEKVVPFGRRLKKTAVVACVAVMALGTTVFAADRIYNTYFKQNGYEATLYKEAASIADVEEKNTFEDNKYIAIDMGYLPEGITYDPSSGKYNGITAEIFNESEGELGKILYVTNAAEYEFDGKKAYVFTKDGFIYNREVYVVFENTNYFIHMFVLDMINDDELKKILENCSLAGTDDESLAERMVINSRENINAYKNSYYSTDNNGEISYSTPLVDVTKAGGVGTTAKSIYTDATVSYTLNSYSVVDSLSDIELDESRFSDQYMEEKDKALNPDGTLKPEHLTIIKSGDGVNTLNEVVGERDAERVFLIADITISAEGRQIDVMSAASVKTTKKEEPGCYVSNSEHLSYDGMPVYNGNCVDTGKSFYIAANAFEKPYTYKLIYVVYRDELDTLYLDFGYNYETNVQEIINIK